MKEQSLENSSLLVENKRRVKEVYGWESGLIHLACAGIYTSKQMLVDFTVLSRCKQLIKQKVGLFSNFRSTAQPMIASILATSENPEQTLEHGLYIYHLLKKDFWSSYYLPVTAMIIAQTVDPNQFEAVASRTRRIYERIKKEHPFLTSSEDSANCALLALSEKSDDELIHEIEFNYHFLKSNFFSSNAVQSLSHVLAILPGDDLQKKCGKTMELFYGLKRDGYKYGTSYELPTLGVLAMTEEPINDIVQEVVEINQWLSGQKGFGFFSSITTKQRLMYAGMIAQSSCFSNITLQTATTNSAISIIIAQQAAMCAIIAATAASSSAAASAGASS